MATEFIWEVDTVRVAGDVMPVLHPSEAVYVIMEIDPIMVAVRLASAQAVNELVDALITQRNRVFPECNGCTNEED